MTVQRTPLVIDLNTGGTRQMKADEVLGVGNGGTGVASIPDFKTALNLDKVENKTGAEILSGLAASDITTALGYTPSSSAGVSVQVATHIFSNVPPVLSWSPHGSNPIGSQIGGMSSYGGATGANSTYFPAGLTGWPAHQWSQAAGETGSLYGLGSDQVQNPHATNDSLFEAIFQTFAKGSSSTNAYTIGWAENPSFNVTPDPAAVGKGIFLARQNVGGVDYLSIYVSDGTNIFVYQGAPIAARRQYYFRLYYSVGTWYATLEYFTNNVRTVVYDNFAISGSSTAGVSMRLWCGFVPTSSAVLTNFQIHHLSYKVMMPQFANYQMVTKILGSGVVQNPSGAVTALLDFGQNRTSTSVEVNDPEAVVGNLYFCSIQPVGDEFEFENINAAAVCKVNGKVTIYAASNSGPISGTRKVAYRTG